MNFRRLRPLTRRIPLILAALLVGISLFRLDAGKALSASESALSRSRETAVSPKKSPQDTLHIASIYGQLPLSFEPNQGQTDPRVKFLARGGGYGLYLTGSEAVLALHSAGKQNSIIRMSLEDSKSGQVVGAQDELPGKSNYFIGNDPAKWHRNIPQFARVRYHDVYPGIDLVYYGHQGKLEYDFEVSPGADPKQIALQFQGSPRLALTAAGDLSIATKSGNVQLQAPRVYQQIGYEDRSIAGKFVLLSDNQVAFEIGAYDRTQRLVIDPILTYSTYLGGSGDESCSKIEQTQLRISTAQFTPGCPAIAVDAAFRTYVAGATTSTNFPGMVLTATSTTPASFQACLDVPPANPTSPVNPSSCPNLSTNSDVFVIRLNAAGTALDFATYLGGTGTDVTAGLAVDQNFNVHIAGTTNSTNPADFPALPTSYQPTPASAGTHVFVSEIAAGGASLLYSTYLSGNGTDIATGLAIDNLGKEYVTGTTTSSNFPTTATAFQGTPKATNQSFFAKLDPTITGPGALLYSTYIGGSAPTTGVMVGGGVAVDTNCNAYLTGGTNFTDLFTQNAPQGTNRGGLDAWVAKFSVPTGSSCGSLLSLTYLTYFGGSGDDVGYGIAVDTGFNAYITGSTTSPDIVLPAGSTGPAPFARCLNLPPVSGPYPAPPCPSSGTMPDAFVAKFGSLTTGTTGTNVPYLYFTYLGGSQADTGTAIAADTIGGAFVTGWTTSSDFPTAVLSGTAVQTMPGGGEDAFVARIDTTTICASNPPTVVCPGYTSYLGGSGTDIGTGIALDSGSSTYVTGETASPNFPVIKPFQTALNGPTDAFVTKLGSVGTLQLTATAPTTIGVGNSVAFTYTLINAGDATSGIIVTDALPSTGATFNSIATTVGNCGTVVTSTVTCSIGTLNSGGTATITVNLTPTAQTTPLTSPGGLSNSIAASAPGAQTVTASSTAAVQDFNIAVQPGTPATITVPAGVPANFTIQVTGTLSNFPDSISLSVGAGLPSATSTAWTTNPIPSLTGSSQTTVLTVTTTARVTTTGFLGNRRGALYAIWLPVSGMAFLGLGIGRRPSRKRRIFLGLMLAGFLSLVFFQAGCGSSSTTTTTTGTPAGTYTLTVNATSGTATRTTTVTLIVQ